MSSCAKLHHQHPAAVDLALRYKRIHGSASAPPQVIARVSGPVYGDGRTSDDGLKMKRVSGSKLIREQGLVRILDLCIREHRVQLDPY